MTCARMDLQPVSSLFFPSLSSPLFCTASFAESPLSLLKTDKLLGSVGCRIIQAEDLETWVFGLKVLGDESETVYSGGEFLSQYLPLSSWLNRGVCIELSADRIASGRHNRRICPCGFQVPTRQNSLLSLADLVGEVPCLQRFRFTPQYPIDVSCTVLLDPPLVFLSFAAISSPNHSHFATLPSSSCLVLYTDCPLSHSTVA